MTNSELIKEVKKYFGIKELVSKQVYERYGEDKCWCFFNKQMLETLLVIRRDIVKAPMIVNDWASKGQFSQRGLRANKDPMVTSKTGLYLSAHVLGCGIDFHCKTITPKNVRKLIVEKQDLLPYSIRLEDDKSAPTWVHFDLATISDEKITFFSA